MVRLACRPILLVAALLAAILPPGAPTPRSASAATPAVRLSPNSGYVGLSFTVFFSGFPKQRTVTVTWDGKALASTTSSAAGDGAVSMRVPTAKKGGHAVTAISGRASSAATFNVVPRIWLSPTATPVGARVSVTLRGYAKGEAITITLDSSTKTLATVTASATGSASAQIVVPPAVGGRHKVSGLGATGSLSRATLVVRPSVALTPASGQVGSNIRVALRGYAQGELVEIQWSDPFRSLGLTTTSATGSANVTVAVPNGVEPGTYAIIGRGYSVSFAESPFTVTSG
jgi:hypothetical protein